MTVKNVKEKKGKNIKTNEDEEKKKSEELLLIKKEIKILKEKFLCSKAENENIRKRHKVIVEDIHKYCITKLAKEIVLHIEDLNRAIENIKNKKINSIEIEKTFINGLELVKQNFKKGLMKFDIYRIYPQNQKFDFHFQEAVSQISDKTKSPNTVIEVVQAGYRIGTRVIKAAKVIVSK